MPIISDETLSTSFRVDPRLLKLLQGQQVMTVHNDGDGRLLSIETPDRHKHDTARMKFAKPQLVGEQS